MCGASRCRVAWCAWSISRHRVAVNPLFAKFFKRRPFPRRGKFFEKFFVDVFRGHFTNDPPKAAYQKPRHNAAALRPWLMRTRQHERPHHTASTAADPARDHQETDTQSRRKGPAPSRRENRGGAFQVAADHADKCRPASKLYAHTRTHQHNTHAEHRHTQRHTPKKKPPDCQPEKHTPRNPGESGKHQTPANENTRTQSTGRPQAIQYTARGRPRINSRAPAREKVLRARYFIFAGSCAQNFPRFGAKNQLPTSLRHALEGGQKHDKRQMGGQHAKIPQSCTIDSPGGCVRNYFLEY